MNISIQAIDKSKDKKKKKKKKKVEYLRKIDFHKDQSIFLESEKEEEEEREGFNTRSNN